MNAFRVMSFNIRGSHSTKDGVNAWANRAALNVKTIRSYSPDLIGFQELEEGNLKEYQVHFSDYGYVLGPSYGNREPFEYPAVFWKASRFDHVASGGVWLSKTPQRYSRGWDAAVVRSATWVKLRIAGSDNLLLHVNTHLDHEGAVARTEGAKVVVGQIAQHETDVSAVVVTGDFNSSPDSPGYHLFTERWFSDAYVAGGRRPGEASSTFHAFKGDDHHTVRMDWILFKAGQCSIRAKSHLIVTDHKAPLYPSDHYPVVADLEI